MPDRRSVLIGIALACGYAIVLAGPALLLWNVLRPEPWNERSVKVRFDYVRLQAGGLVFTYTVENRNERSASFSPEISQLRVLQPSDAPEAGYASVGLPLEFAAGTTRQVEIRLDLQSPLGPSSIAAGPPGRLGDLPGNRQPSPPDRLRDINGFELTDQRGGLRIVFPRAW